MASCQLDVQAFPAKSSILFEKKLCNYVTNISTKKDVIFHGIGTSILLKKAWHGKMQLRHWICACGGEGCTGSGWVRRKPKRQKLAPKRIPRIPSFKKRNSYDFWKFCLKTWPWDARIFAAKFLKESRPWITEFFPNFFSLSFFSQILPSLSCTRSTWMFWISWSCRVLRLLKPWRWAFEHVMSHETHLRQSWTELMSHPRTQAKKNKQKKKKQTKNKKNI